VGSILVSCGWKKSQENRSYVWEDKKKVLAEMGLPVI
jgi:ribosomal protein L37E